MSDVNNITIQNAVKAWITENDPSSNKSIGLAKNSGKIMAVSVDPDQPTDLAVSAAAVVGTCDTKAIDAKMRSAVSDGYEAAIEEFKKHPLVGCTTVLDMARIASGYNPNEGSDKEKQEKYDDYVQRIMKCPFLHLERNEHEYYHRKETSWSTAIKEIANLYTGVTEKDKEKISETITNLANSAASNKNTRQGKSLFSVSTLRADEHTVEAIIFSTSISLIENEEKGSDSKQTDLDIIMIYLTFEVDMWPYHAEAVYNKHLELIDDWLDDNSTKPGPEPTNLCIGGYKRLH